MRASVDAAFGLGYNLQWDAYQRGLYTKINTALDRQASLLRQRGLVTEAEVRALVGQRNKVLLEARSPLSTFGRLYSEILKPSNDLPTFEKLLRHKGSIEAIIQIAGKTRATTNRMVAAFRVVGRGTVVLQMALPLCWRSVLNLRIGLAWQPGKGVVSLAGESADGREHGLDVPGHRS